MTLMGFDAFRDADRAVEQALGANRLTLGNGVLTLSVPVDESSKPRRVDMSSAPSNTNQRTTIDETPPGTRPEGNTKGDV